MKAFQKKKKKSEVSEGVPAPQGTSLHLRVHFCLLQTPYSTAQKDSSRQMKTLHSPFKPALLDPCADLSPGMTLSKQMKALLAESLESGPCDCLDQGSLTGLRLFKMITQQNPPGSAEGSHINIKQMCIQFHLKESLVVSFHFKTKRKQKHC